MKTVIACTDFTQSSINACKYAAMYAQDRHCKLVLFNLFEAPVMHSNTGLYGLSYASERKSSEHKTKKIMGELQRLFPKLKISPFVTSGSFGKELESFTLEHQVEAAVMGLESKSRIEKYIYGSHGVNIVGKINTSVIIVPEGYRQHELSNILLAVDNTEKLHKSSLSSFEAMLRETKAALTILHIRTESEIFNPVVHELKINGKKRAIETISAKNLQIGIKKYCTGGDFDLIGIISKKHSVFYNLFSESSTKKISFIAKIPVMAIHE